MNNRRRKHTSARVRYVGAASAAADAVTGPTMVDVVAKSSPDIGVVVSSSEDMISGDEDEDGVVPSRDKDKLINCVELASVDASVVTVVSEGG